MAITIADKFEYDIPAQATTKKLPLNVYKLLIMKLFNMAPFSLIPDKIYFIEESKAYTPVVNAKGETLEVVREGRLLLNGEDTLVIGLKPGEGTNVATLNTYLFKAARSVSNLSTWLD